MSQPVTFVWPGDLHLETADRENYRVALWMADEVNELVRPDFVQFAGDNVQHATLEQFQLFKTVCDRLKVPWHGLVGDHDAHHDPGASGYRAHVGEPYGAYTLDGYRFIRLNTMEFKPLGLKPDQIHWFRYQVELALTNQQRIVVFQHHYPFQLWEDFRGPGIDGWREIVTTRPVEAIFAGHTHYGQLANDGHNLMVATRSIGDPEGGPAGFAVVHLDGDDFAVAYRSIEDTGPLVMVTHPRDAILARHGGHVVKGPARFRVRTWSREPVQSARGQVDQNEWFALESSRDGGFTGPLAGELLAKGEHNLAVEVTDSKGQTGRANHRFAVDRSGRYTSYPRVRPEVTYTKFC
jgi:3',5'-cyclic-AMP phosphodiesterase